MKPTQSILVASILATLTACGGEQSVPDNEPVSTPPTTDTVDDGVCLGTVTDDGQCERFEQITFSSEAGEQPLFNDLSVLPATRTLNVRAEGVHLARVPFHIERDGVWADFYVENLANEPTDIDVNFTLAEDGTLTLDSTMGGITMNEASTWTDTVEGVYSHANNQRTEADLWTRLLAADSELADDAWREQITLQTPSPADQITLVRSGCYGSCPDYEVTVSGDGAVTFDGHRFTMYTGHATASLDTELTEELFGAVRYMQPLVAPLNADGTPAEAPDANCREVTDMATSVLRWTLDGVPQELTHYHGCNSYEFRRQLNALEDLIDLTSGAEEWVGW